MARKTFHGQSAELPNLVSFKAKNRVSFAKLTKQHGDGYYQHAKQETDISDIDHSVLKGFQARQRHGAANDAITSAPTSSILLYDSLRFLAM